MTKRVLTTVAAFLCGAFLTFALYVLAGVLMEHHFQLGRHLREARLSNDAYTNASAALRSKNEWRDFIALPTIGCLIGVYSALLEKRKAALLAVACLLPMFVFEASGVSVRSWAFTTDLQVLASRIAEIILAALMATALRRFLDRQHARPD